MPCYEVRTMSVEFKAKHRGLLEDAIMDLGWKYEGSAGGLRVMTGAWYSFTIDLETQRVDIQSGQQAQLNQLKRQYSKRALMRASRLCGWQFKQQGPQLQGVLRK